MRELFSVIVGRSGVIAYQSDNAGDRRSFDLRFKATASMVPSAKLIVYYIHSSGEIIFNQIELKFNENFANHVSRTIDVFLLEAKQEVR